MEKVTLRPLALDDLVGVHSLWSDEAATLFTNFRHLPTLEACRERLGKILAHYAQNPLHFGPFVIVSESGAFLGLAGGDAVDADRGLYEIWYFVQRRHWGKKIATSAVHALLTMMSESGRVRDVKAEAVADNEPSWRFLEKLGFKRTAHLPGAHKKDGRTFDRYDYLRRLAVLLLAALTLPLGGPVRAADLGGFESQYEKPNTTNERRATPPSTCVGDCDENSLKLTDYLMIRCSDSSASASSDSRATRPIWVLRRASAAIGSR